MFNSIITYSMLMRKEIQLLFWTNSQLHTGTKLAATCNKICMFK